MHGFLKGMLLSGLALGWMGCGPKTTEDRASLKRAAVAPAPAATEQPHTAESLPVCAFTEAVTMCESPMARRASPSVQSR